MRRIDVASGVRVRSLCRHPRGVLSVTQDLRGVVHRVLSGSIEPQNPAGVAYEGCHRNHHGRPLVVLFDVRPGCLRVAFGRPPRLGCVAATSQEKCTCGLSVVTATVQPRFTFGPCTASATCAPGDDRSLEPSRRRRMRGPSPEPRQSPHGCPIPPEPAHFQWPSDGHRGTDTSQRRRRRSARSVSVSSQPRCTLGFTSGPTLRRSRGALGIDQSSETEPTTLHARAVMDRSRSAYLHDNGMGSHLRRYLCCTYDGTHAVSTT
jgi:hypothetical protein